MRIPAPNELAAIQMAVRRRHFHRARRLIAEFMGSREGSPESPITAARCLLQSSDPLSALMVLEEARAGRSLGGIGAADRAFSTRATLQLARTLNLAGSSAHSLRILDSLTHPELAADPDATVEIFNTNALHGRSIAFLKEPATMRGLELADRLRLLRLAEAWFETGRKAGAIALLRELIAHTPERIPRAIAHRALGSLLIREERLFEAETALETSEALFGNEGSPADRGQLDLWQGALLIGNGYLSRARARLRRAWKSLYRPGLKPEDWLEVLYFQGLLAFRDAGRFPEQWYRIVRYPGATRSPIVSWIEETAGLSGLVILDGGRVGHWPSPEGLAALLMSAGSPGIPLLRACETLWPDEPFSLDSSVRRMEQLIQQCRRERGLPVRQASFHLKMGHPKAGRRPGLSRIRTPGSPPGAVLEKSAVQPASVSVSVARCRLART